MRSLLVVMGHVRGQHAVEMVAADDHYPVEALASHRTDPALGVCPRPRRADRRLDHADAFGAEDFVKVTDELAVSIADEEPWADILVIERHQHVACLLDHPPPVGIRRDPCEPNATSGELGEEQNVEALQEERVDREEVALEDARRLLPEELDPLVCIRFGAGSIPSSLRIVQTVLAASFTPSPTSSP
jgi:hypothetical protein